MPPTPYLNHNQGTQQFKSCKDRFSEVVLGGAWPKSISTPLLIVRQKLKCHWKPPDIFPPPTPL